MVIDTRVAVMECVRVTEGLLPISLISEIGLTLLSHCLHEALTLHWAKMCLKLVRFNEVGGLTH